MVLCLLSSSSALLQSDLCGLWGPQYHGFELPEDSAILGRGRAKDREGREWFGTTIAVGDILLTGGTFSSFQQPLRLLPLSLQVLEDNIFTLMVTVFAFLYVDLSHLAHLTGNCILLRFWP